MLSLTTA